MLINCLGSALYHIYPINYIDVAILFCPTELKVECFHGLLKYHLLCLQNMFYLPWPYVYDIRGSEANAVTQLKTSVLHTGRDNKDYDTFVSHMCVI
jgi:hypothetical protein